MSQYNGFYLWIARQVTEALNASFARGKPLLPIGIFYPKNRLKDIHTVNTLYVFVYDRVYILGLCSIFKLSGLVLCAHEGMTVWSGLLLHYWSTWSMVNKASLYYNSRTRLMPFFKYTNPSNQVEIDEIITKKTFVNRSYKNIFHNLFFG